MSPQPQWTPPTADKQAWKPPVADAPKAKSRTFADSVSDAGNAFWEWTGKPVTDALLLSEGTDQERAAKAREAQAGIVKNLANEPGRVRDEFTKSLDAFVAGNPRATLHHALNSIPLVGAGINQTANDFKEGNYAKGVGHLFALLSPAAARELPAIGRAVAESKAGDIVSGAVEGARQGATAPMKLKARIRGVPIEWDTPVPAYVAEGGAGATGGAAIGSLFGAPIPGAVLGGLAGSALPAVRGAVRGARARMGPPVASWTEPPVSAIEVPEPLPTVPRVPLATQQGVELQPTPRTVPEFSATPAVAFPERPIRPVETPAVQPRVSMAERAGVTVEPTPNVVPEFSPAPQVAFPQRPIRPTAGVPKPTDLTAPRPQAVETPGMAMARESGQDWASLSAKDQAMMEHIAQGRTNAAAQVPQPNEYTSPPLQPAVPPEPANLTPIPTEPTIPPTPPTKPFAEMTKPELFEALGLPPNATTQQLVQRLYEETEASGTAAPKSAQVETAPPDPTGLAEMARETPQRMRKEVAKANYRAVKEGAAEQNTASPVYESTNRMVKVDPVVRAILDNGVTYSDMVKLTKPELESLINQLSKATAAETGEHPGNVFSKLSMDEVMGELRRAEEAAKGNR